MSGRNWHTFSLVLRPSSLLSMCFFGLEHSTYIPQWLTRMCMHMFIYRMHGRTYKEFDTGIRAVFCKVPGQNSYIPGSWFASSSQYSFSSKLVASLAIALSCCASTHCNKLYARIIIHFFVHEGFVLSCLFVALAFFFSSYSSHIALNQNRYVSGCRTITW